METSVRCECQ